MERRGIWSEIPRLDLRGTAAPPSAAVCDAMRPDAPVISGGLRPVTARTTMMGPALTALLAPGHNLGVHVALSIARPGDVLIVACEGAATGVLGGLLAAFAVRSGLQGLVTDGWVRDVAELRDLDLALWAAAISPAGTGKEDLRGVNVPVMIGGVMVRPGDLIVGDDDGVVAIPRASAVQVVEQAHEVVARGARLAHDIETSGESTMSLLTLDERVAAAGVRREPGPWSSAS